MHSVRPQGRRRVRPGALAMVAAASLLVGVVGPSAPAQAADITDGLALWYKLDATSGTVAVDSSGNGRNGTVNGTAGWSGTGEGLTFNGSDTYIKVPDNIMSGMNSITVSTDVQIDAAQTTPYFLYGFGNTSDGAGNGYLFTSGNTFRTAIASGELSTEQNTKTSARTTAARGLEARHLHPDRHHGRALPGRCGGGPQHVGHHHTRFHRGRHHHGRLHRQVPVLGRPVLRREVATSASTTGPCRPRTSWSSAATPPASPGRRTRR